MARLDFNRGVPDTPENREAGIRHIKQLATHINLGVSPMLVIRPRDGALIVTGGPDVNRSVKVVALAARDHDAKPQMVNLGGVYESRLPFAVIAGEDKELGEIKCRGTSTHRVW